MKKLIVLISLPIIINIIFASDYLMDMGGGDKYSLSTGDWYWNMGGGDLLGPCKED